MIYMPRLDTTAIPSPFREWAITRFIRRYPYGHILTAEPYSSGSVEMTVPLMRTHWYCRTIPKRIPKAQAPVDASVEIFLPLAINSPGIQMLQVASDWVPIRRVVVRRPSDTMLPRLAQSIETLSMSFDFPLWLDWTSFGWDALTYLFARFPNLQVDAVPEGEFWNLVRLSIWSGRHLVLGNIDTDRCKAFDWHPTLDNPMYTARVTNSLPVSGRSQ